MKSGYQQLAMLSKRRPLAEALNDPAIDNETKRKIRLVQETKQFAERQMSLAHTKNYETFVKLNDRYVTYAVSAAFKDRLEPFLWSFPIVGKVPYKGFFKRPDAEAEERELIGKDFDTYVRGVGAYSTLGWFSDPLLSSMMNYSDEDLVDTIIHETTHATVYIKSNADFNEQLATFVGGKGMAEFYRQKEGPDSSALERSKLSQQDTKIFSQWISHELLDLEQFYKSPHQSLAGERKAYFAGIQARFQSNCKPLLRTQSYSHFADMALNNAILLGFKTYFQDLDLFEKVWDRFNHDWRSFVGYFQGIKKSTDPEREVRRFLNN